MLMRMFRKCKVVVNIVRLSLEGVGVLVLWYRLVKLSPCTAHSREIYQVLLFKLFMGINQSTHTEPGNVSLYLSPKERGLPLYAAYLQMTYPTQVGMHSSWLS